MAILVWRYWSTIGLRGWDSGSKHVLKQKDDCRAAWKARRVLLAAKMVTKVRRVGW